MSPQKTTEKRKPAPHVDSLAARQQKGKELRDMLPRKNHAMWEAPSGRPDVIDVLEESNAGRIPELVPIRYGRMVKSPFTFYRGTAALMASDLASTPDTGMRVQSCGDCHLHNFGAYATPERNLIVEINDFDETLPAPWEWDLKRLATSFVLACREIGLKESACRAVAERAVRSYRLSMEKFSMMKVLDVWYMKMDLEAFIASVKERAHRELMIAYINKAKQKSTAEHIIPRLTVQEGGRRVFKDMPPFLYHSDEHVHGKFFQVAQETFQTYKDSLPEDRRVLLNRYELQDVARKVVGIGSVGTYCGILLLAAGTDDYLILQVKEARESVLAQYAGESVYKNHGQRVVVGQRIMQSHSDIFLGWTQGTGPQKRHFFVRQLKDMKMSLTPEIWDTTRALEVARGLGSVLARAHARSGDAAMISGYLGTRDVIDKAIADFAVAYANQTERDHKKLVEAVGSGRVEAFIER